MTPLERINSITKICVNTEEVLTKLVEEINEADYIAVDTETSSLIYTEIKLAGISFYMGGSNAYYLPIEHITEQSYLPSAISLSVIKDSLKDKKLLFHNFVFDCLVLRKYGIDTTTNQYFDTIVATHLLDNNSSKRLKDLALKHFGYQQTKFDVIAASVNYDSRRINLKVITPYACDDVIVTYLLFEKYKNELTLNDLDNLFYNIEMPWLPVLVITKEAGVRFDKQRMVGYLGIINKDIEEIEKEIFSYNSSNQVTLFGGTVQSFNLASTQELALFLYKKLKLPIHKRNETGAASTNDESLQAIIDKHPVVELILRHRKMLTYKKMFIKPLPGKVEVDGRIRPDFINTRAATGRLSSKNPNFQQLPNIEKLSGWEKEFALKYDIRGCLIVEEGETMIAIDYSSQEMRVAAFMGQDEVLTEVFNKDLDPHLTTANGVFNLNLTTEELTKGSDGFNKAKKEFYSQRDKGKTANFQVLYGAGPSGLQRELKNSEQEAKQIVEGFKKTYKGIIKAQARAAKEGVEQGYTRNYFGRKETFKKPEDKKQAAAIAREAGNFIIQGTCADITRIVARKIYEEFKDTDLKFQLFVHDEIVFSCKTENATEYAKRLKHIMETTVEMNPPLICDVGFGKSYSEAK